jgi:hypothetical protein
MAGVEGSKGPAPISPSERKQYEDEYRRGAALFQEAVEDYELGGDKFKNKEFSDVMRKAMDVLNQAARALHDEQRMREANTIQKDLALFQKDPSDLSRQKLIADLEQAQQ